MKYDITDQPHLFELTFKDKNGEERTFSCDILEGEKFIATLQWKKQEAIEKGKGLVEATEQFYAEYIPWLEEHGGQNMPEYVCQLLIGYLFQAVDEFKKKVDPTIRSRIFTESTPSVLQKVKDGSLKLASGTQSPGGNSDTVAQQPTLPQNDSTN